MTVLGRDPESSAKSIRWLCQCDCGATKSVDGQRLRIGRTKSCGCQQGGVKDRLGLRYGKGLVIAFEGTKDRKAWWRLKCDCGNEYVVIGASLESGNTRSCGCGHHIDMTGRRFGRLTVLQMDDVDGAGNARWSCRCDCGVTKTVDGSKLRRGETKSCGCARMEPKNDVVGETFGYLTVLSRTSGTNKTAAKYLCKCTCGRETTTVLADLKSGHTKSCGKCSATSLLDDLTGRKFGNVTVVRRVASPNPNVSRWLYRCVCGRERETYRSSLITGGTTSCGCVRRFDWKGVLYRSRMEVFTAMALEVLGLDFEYEKETFRVEVGGKLKKYTPDFHLLGGDAWLEVKGTTFRDGVPKFLEFSKTHRATLLNQREVQQLTGRSLVHMYRTWLSGPQVCYDTIERALSDSEKRKVAMQLIV